MPPVVSAPELLVPGSSPEVFVLVVEVVEVVEVVVVGPSPAPVVGTSGAVEAPLVVPAPASRATPSESLHARQPGQARQKRPERRSNPSLNMAISPVSHRLCKQ